jgi:hypothetical protein
MYRSFSPHLYIHRLPGLERVAKLTNDGNISRFEFSPLNDEVAVSSRAGGSRSGAPPTGSARVT